VGAFNSCFLAFAGFEVFSTAGKNIENPSKNISKGIILVMIISATFYILCTILFFLAFTDFSQNINMFAWARFMNDPKLKWLYYVGPIIMLIGILGLRVNSMTQKSFYAGTIVQPMSEEGFFPESFGVLSKKDNMSVKASFLNIVITLIVAFI
jgi:amino acid transporter